VPILPPQLDDLRYDRTVEELVRRIPVHTPDWTDVNESDPGQTLLELFAYLAEQIGYRLNRVPEKNEIELLKLLGIRLLPAQAARTSLALLLSDPSTLAGYTLAAGARAKAKKGQPPPSFETDRDVDVVPAEGVVLITTEFPYLYDVLKKSPTERDQPASFPEVPNNDTEWLTVAWDGKKPKLKDMPSEPVTLFRRGGQTYLWLGLDCNLDPDAGFRGVRVTLSAQLDDDEQPALTDPQECRPMTAGKDAPLPAHWLWYYDAVTQDLQEVPGRIDDTTARLTRSGTLRFTVPLTIGPIPPTQFADLRPESVPTPLEACVKLTQALSDNVLAIPQPAFDVSKFQTALLGAAADAQAKAAAAQPAVGHPLDAKLRDPNKVRAWLRFTLANPLDDDKPSPRLRIVTFNAVPVTNATTVTAELLGVADGRPGQTYPLAHGNVLAGSLQLAMQEAVDPTTPLVPWTEVDSLDPAGPFDSVFALDREAGFVQFGDGRRGRIPPLVPNGGQVVALSYRYGGGKAGEVPVAAMTALETPANGVAGVVNFIAAQGGRDAETLELAKIRARKTISTRSRAVTAGDFQWLALQTPGVRVARAEVVPLRRPLPAGPPVPLPNPVACGPAPPTAPAGLSDTPAAGVVTVVVVPDLGGPEPLPTPSFLRAVCRQLDQYRLVTTEVWVAPPQYVRLCNFLIEVRALPGYTRARLQDLVEANLSTYLHVLKGGDDGNGFPFGGQLHVADLVARVFRTEGVERVESLSAQFTRTKTNAVPRQGKLVLCPQQTGDTDRVRLAPEETVSFDVTTLMLTTTV
jgi:predicted phage baseplate assembly protein